MSLASIDSAVLLTFRSASEILGTSENRVRRLVRNRQLAAVRVGKRLMIAREAIPRFIEENTIPPADGVAKKKVVFPFKKFAGAR